MRQTLLATVLLTSAALAQNPYIDRIQRESTPLATRQAQLKGIDDIAQCSEQKEEDLTIFHCLGKGEVPAYITIVQFKDDTKGAVFNYTPYGLGEGPDAFVLEQQQDDVDATYVLQLPDSSANNDSQRLFSHLPFPTKRTQYFLAHKGCENLQGSPRIGIDDKHWLPTWMIRQALRYNSSIFEGIYQDERLDQDALDRAPRYRETAKKRWNSLMHNYCF